MKSLILLLALTGSMTAFAGGRVDPIKEVFEPAGDFPADKFFKVAVIQWNPAGVADVNATAESAEEFKQGNREAMAELITEAAGKGAQFISLSEFAVDGYPEIPGIPDEDQNYRNRDDIKYYVEPIPGKSTKYFSALAKQLKVYIQFGMAEVDTATKKYYNTAVVIDPTGAVVAKYHKQHLYQIEENFLTPGNEEVTLQTPAGLMGFIVCSDSYAPNVLSAYQAKHIDVLSLSTSWAQENTGMGVFKQAARSTGAYLLAANQNYYPDSGVINPDGTTQSWIRQSRNSIAYGYLPLKDSSASRRGSKRR